MRDGFIKAAAITPEVHVADPESNKNEIIRSIDRAVAEGARILVYPELSLTGYTCADLFLQNTLQEKALGALRSFIEETRGFEKIFFVGLPWRHGHRLFNAVAAVSRGALLGVVPKRCPDRSNGMEESRYFSQADPSIESTAFTYANGETVSVPFGTDLVFSCRSLPELTISVTVGTDLLLPDVPAGSSEAAVTVVPAAASCRAGDRTYETVASALSTVCHSAVIVAGAGNGETTNDVVFAGKKLIAENGMLSEENPSPEVLGVLRTLDVRLLSDERMRSGFAGRTAPHRPIEFSIRPYLAEIRTPDRNPFLPHDEAEWPAFLDQALEIQARSLAVRMRHIHCQKAIIGISGGLDSTLALIVAAKAADLLSLPRTSVLAVTMPCFGTTDRTYTNACEMTRAIGAELREIPIADAVTVHFENIGHDPSDHNVTFENAQARERTQVLMDIANDVNGLVVGTGDMSELALGWATYNGDHMSMYAVNGGVPKTVIRKIVARYADVCRDETLAAVLRDVLDTPVSPELLPPESGEIRQKTEELVGPYELHDFYLYYVLRYGFAPEKIFRLARKAFAGTYTDETIRKWLKNFYNRFFKQQYKRSCLPDGPRVFDCSLSPRGGLAMPSDTNGKIWLEEAGQQLETRGVK